MRCHVRSEGCPGKVAVDNSAAMIRRCQEYLNAQHVRGTAPRAGAGGQLPTIDLALTSLVARNFTLQFIPPSSACHLGAHPPGPAAGR